MLSGCRHIVAGLSGGADSVCLLLILHEAVSRYKLPVSLSAVHVHHGIRGAEADQDADFSASLAGRLGIPFACCREDIPAFAEQSGISEEAAGRLVRYRIFEQEARRYSINFGEPYENGSVRIAVAHHMDDQAETVLLHLFRGSGLNGLSGIQPVRGNIIRPLLCVSRAQIEQYLESEGQPYRTDSTNADNRYTRNQIRNVVLPYIRKQFNPQFASQLSELSSELSGIQGYIRRQAAALWEQCIALHEGGSGLSIRLSVFAGADPVIRQELLYMAFCSLSGRESDLYRIHRKQLEALAGMQVGKKLHLPDGIFAVRTYEELVLFRGNDASSLAFAEKEGAQQRLSKYKEKDKAGMNDFVKTVERHELDRLFEKGDAEGGRILRIPVGRQAYIHGIGYRCVCSFLMEASYKPEYFGNNDYTKYFDYDTIRGNLDIRFRQPGDYIAVYPDGQVRKLKKEFIDRKILQKDRESVILLADGHEVLWAAGVRRGEAHRVGRETERILKVTVCIQED